MRKLIFVILGVFAININLHSETPDNEKLYEIILELKKNQNILLKDLDNTKKELQDTENKLKQTEQALKAEFSNDENNKRVLLVDESEFEDSTYLNITPSFNRINTDFLGFAKKSNTSNTQGISNEVKTESYAPGLELVYGNSFDDGSGWKIKLKGTEYRKKDSINDLTQGGTSYLFGSNFIHNAMFNIQPDTNLDNAFTQLKSSIYNLSYIRDKKINILDFLKFDLEYGATAISNKQSSENKYVDGSRTLTLNMENEIRGIGPTFAVGSVDGDYFNFKLFSSLLFSEIKSSYYSIESDNATQFIDSKDDTMTLIPSIGFNIGMSNKDNENEGLFYDINYKIEHTIDSVRRHKYIDDTAQNHYVVEESSETVDSIDLLIGYKF